MKKTAEDHWSYIKNLTEATLAGNAETSTVFSREELLTLIGFHYRSAFIHGWKHGLEALRATEVPCTLETTVSACCCAEAEAAFCAPSAAVSGAEAARRVLDADNSGEAKPRNIADFGDNYGTYKEHIESFLREDR